MRINHLMSDMEVRGVNVCESVISRKLKQQRATLVSQKYFPR
jgi:hypothetical protein